MHKEFRDVYVEYPDYDIRFRPHHTLINNFARWRTEDKFPGRSFDLIKNDGEFIFKQLIKLQESINNTRVVVHSLKIAFEQRQKEDQLEFAEDQEEALGTVSVQHAAAAFFSYVNLRERQKQDGGNVHSFTREVELKEAWLASKIFDKPNGLQQSVLTQDQIHYYVDLFACVKQKQLLNKTVCQVKCDEKFVEKMLQFDQEQLQAFCQYYALCLNGIVNTIHDPYSVKQVQMVRIAHDLDFSLDFCEYFNYEVGYEQNDDDESLSCRGKFSGQYIVGKIVPWRKPELDEEGARVKRFNYCHQVIIADIKTVQKDFEVELPQKHKYEILSAAYLEDATNAAYEKQNIQQIPWTELHCDYESLTDGQLGLFDVFLKNTVSQQNEQGQSEFLNRYVNMQRINDYVNSFELKDDIFSKVVFKSRDNVMNDLVELSAFNFHREKRQWLLKDRETLYMENQYSQRSFDWGTEKDIVEKISKNENAEKLIQIIEQIPTLDIKLSVIQKAVLASSENLLCLGRSGTGKTTTSVLRLFSQEIMYKSIKKFQEVKATNKKNKGKELPERTFFLESEDFRIASNMKTVFISASPVLVNEVNKYYENLKEALIAYLKKKEAKKSADQMETTKESEEIDEQIVAQQKELLKVIQIQTEDIEEELARNTDTDLPDAFEDLRPRHFPLFITIKQLLFMLDASLRYPFFYRNQSNKIVHLENNLAWHNENKGLYMINTAHRNVADYDDLLLKYAKELIEGDVQENEADQIGKNEEEGMTEKKQPQDKRSQQWNYHYGYARNGQQMSFEVDFEIFRDRFIPTLEYKYRKTKNKLSDALVWTEIFSVIKGGFHSNKHYSGFIPAKIYIKEHGSQCLSHSERGQLYWIFLRYEQWKEENAGYDQMDLVHHLIKSGKSYWDSGEIKMDYLMIDEVQDLTPKCLQLLIRLTQQKIFFAGDTAQTIAKGVGACFTDLTTAFDTLQIDVVQLRVNYRSHAQILAMANSVVQIIQVLFPFSIDKLEEERADTEGQKPLIIMPMPQKILQQILCGAGKGQVQAVPQAHGMSKPQFGCNQVIIVREQGQKDSIPSFLQNMLCLTVYEAKGLEFEDVILFNFFDFGEAEQSHWKLLNDIALKVSDQESINTVVEEMAKEIQESEAYSQADKKKPTTAKQIEKARKNQEEYQMINASTKNRAMVYRKFALLCVELKYLYVAITRAKTRLIIYDQENKTRKPIQRIWENLGVIDVIRKQDLEGETSQNHEQIKQLQAGFLMQVRSSEEEWKLQGIKFYRKKCFDQAIKCFTFAGEEVLAARCAAFMQAELGQKHVLDIEKIGYQRKNYLRSHRMNGMTVMQLKKMEKECKADQLKGKKEIKEHRNQVKFCFSSAGQSFEKANLLQHAASCYYTARNFSKAATIFEKLGQFNQAGECFIQSKKASSILKAAQLFEKGNLIQRAIECYERLQAWEELLHCMKRNQASFKSSERQAMINKYVPIALNKLYMMLAEEEFQVKEENTGVLQELKIQRKYMKEDDQKIEEEEEYESEEESHSEEEEQPVKVEDIEIEEKGEEGQVLPSLDIKLDIQIPEELKDDKSPSEIDMLSAFDDDMQDSEEDFDNLLDSEFGLTERKKSYQEKLEKKRSKNEDMEVEAAEKLERRTSEQEAAGNLQRKKSMLGEQVQEESKADFDVKKEEQQEVVSDLTESYEMIDTCVKAEDDEDEEIDIISTGQDDDQAKGLEQLIGGSDYEHLSQFDPDDEFLQSNESMSIISSMLSINNQDLRHQTSEFTIISGGDFDVISLNDSSFRGSEHIRFVQGQSKIQDKVVQRIIYFISLFSEDVKSQLDILRQKSAQHPVKKNKASFTVEKEEDFELKDVPLDFIRTVLGILEHFDLMKMCLLLCNSFKMNDSVGRYVVSSCLKYSNLAELRYTQKFAQLDYENSIFKKQRQNSIIAHEALHNVIGLISPKYTMLKGFEEPLTHKNSIGIENYRLILALGFWKKLVYTLNGKAGMQLCIKYEDLVNFQILKTHTLAQISSGKSINPIEPVMMPEQSALSGASLLNQQLTRDQRITQQIDLWETIIILKIFFKTKQRALKHQNEQGKYQSNLHPTTILEQFKKMDSDLSVDLYPLLTEKTEYIREVIQDLIALLWYAFFPKKRSNLQRSHMVLKKQEQKKAKDPEKIQDEQREKAREQAALVIQKRLQLEEDEPVSFLDSPQEKLIHYIFIFQILALDKSLDHICSELEVKNITAFGKQLQLVNKMGLDLLRQDQAFNKDEKAVPSKEKRLVETALFLHHNLQALREDDWLIPKTQASVTGSENLFANFQADFVMMSVYSKHVNVVQRLQENLLQKQCIQKQIKMAKDPGVYLFGAGLDWSEFNKNLKKVKSDFQKNPRQMTPSELNTAAPIAFVADLDIQFIMVPWEWLQRLLCQQMSAKGEEISRLISEESNKILTESSIKYNFLSEVDIFAKMMTKKLLSKKKLKETQTTPKFDFTKLFGDILEYRSIFSSFLEMDMNTVQTILDHNSILRDTYRGIGQAGYVTVKTGHYRKGKCYEETKNQMEKRIKNGIKYYMLHNVLERTKTYRRMTARKERQLELTQLFGHFGSASHELTILLRGKFGHGMLYQGTNDGSAVPNLSKQMIANIAFAKIENTKELALGIIKLEKSEAQKSKQREIESKQGYVFEELFSKVAQLQKQQMSSLCEAMLLFQTLGEQATFIDVMGKMVKWKKKLDGKSRMYASVLDLVQVQSCWQDGSVRLASEKLLKFYDQNCNILEFEELVALLEAAFYPLYIASQKGTAYVPSYVLALLDCQTDLPTLHEQGLKAAGKDHYESTMAEVETRVWYDAQKYQEYDEYLDSAEEWAKLANPYTERDRLEITELEAERAEAAWEAEEQSDEDQISLCIYHKKAPKHFNFEFIAENDQHCQKLIGKILDKAIKLIQLFTGDKMVQMMPTITKKIFNMFTCSAIVKSDPYTSLKISEAFNELDQSPMTDYFNHICFKFFDFRTELHSLPQLFAETEDCYKHSFFAKVENPYSDSKHNTQLLSHLTLVDWSENLHQAQLTNNKVILNNLVSRSTTTVRSIAHRIDAKHIIQKQVSRMIRDNVDLFKNKEGSKFSDEEIKLLKNLKISSRVLDVPQRLGNFAKLLRLAEDFTVRKDSMQDLVLGKGKGLTSCFEVQSLLSKVCEIDKILQKIQATLNGFVREYCSSILTEFVDLSEKPDNSLEPAIRSFEFQKRVIWAELEVWDIRALIKEKERHWDHDLIVRHDMKLKWQSWNSTTQKQMRLVKRKQALQ